VLFGPIFATIVVLNGKGRRKMRFEKGRWISLDMDIVEIWKKHGWEVSRIIPRKERGKYIWVIEAERYEDR